MALTRLLLCFCLYQALPTLAQATTKKCVPAEETITDLENQYEIKISELDLSVSFDQLHILGKTSTENVTEILLDSADVVVAGRLYPKENYTESTLSRNVNTRSVIVQIAEEKATQNRKFTCKVANGELLSRRRAQTKTHLTPQERIEFVLHGLTEACLEIQVCEQFNSLVEDYYGEKSEKKQAVQTHRRSRILRSESADQDRALQNTLNSLFDFGVAAGITKLVDEEGIYHLPEVTTNFTDFAGSTGDFTTDGGIFEGLKTMKRTKDIVFTNDKHHFTMGTTVRLSEARVHLPSYHGRYGIINIYGHVTLKIHGISLTIQVSVDYNSSPCGIHLNEMAIHDVGDIDVEITGLGWPLNNILEPIIRSIIRNNVFEKAKETIAEKVSQLDCEKYRPTIEIMQN